MDCRADNVFYTLSVFAYINSTSEVVLALKCARDILRHVRQRSHVLRTQTRTKTYYTSIFLRRTCCLIYRTDLTIQTRTV